MAAGKTAKAALRSFLFLLIVLAAGCVYYWAVRTR